MDAPDRLRARPVDPRQDAEDRRASPGGPKKKSRPHRGWLFFLGVYLEIAKRFYHAPGLEPEGLRRECGEKAPWMPSSPKTNTVNEFPLGKRPEGT